MRRPSKWVKPRLAGAVPVMNPVKQIAPAATPAGAQIKENTMSVQKIDNSNAVHVPRGQKTHPAGPKANAQPGTVRRVLRRITSRWEDLPVDENGNPIAGQDALGDALKESGWRG